ncbi:uncharacterized protein [Nicotiana tomentosiformis]|uniref:uncharacterized protein n=1 Tax=Nicotiana tomentosiformis TaxID=4098 RepID=UPI00388C7505
MERGAKTKQELLQEGNKKVGTHHKLFMIKAIYWNIRGVRSKKAIHRLKHLIHINNAQFVAIFEPFISKEKIDGYRNFLGFQACISNINGQIWCFWKNHLNTTIIVNEDQHITIKFNEGFDKSNIFITAVYAKCTAAERKDLWDSLENISMSINSPWCIGGDFNVIADPGEKLGGKSHRIYRSLEFVNCLNNCGVTDLGFTGPKYTWCNNRRPRKRI